MQETLHYIFNEGRVMLCHTGDEYYIYKGIEAPAFVADALPHLFVETDETKAYVSSTTTEELPEGYEWVGLRESYKLLPEALYLQAGKASEILYFDTRHRHCGLCGALMRWNTPISKCCTACGDEIWPQLSTAIIVLVHRGEEALLVKAKNFRRNYYGLVAGFVETGESLEECVAREVYEETGITITNIRYHGSQPWPYPMGLMVGFHADYAAGEVSLNDGELSAAAFFSRENLPPIPEKLSMARRLIDSWMESR